MADPVKIDLSFLDVKDDDAPAINLSFLDVNPPVFGKGRIEDTVSNTNRLVETETGVDGPAIGGQPEGSLAISQTRPTGVIGLEPGGVGGVGLFQLNPEFDPSEQRRQSAVRNRPDVREFLGDKSPVERMDALLQAEGDERSALFATDNPMIRTPRKQAEFISPIILYGPTAGNVTSFFNPLFSLIGENVDLEQVRPGKDRSAVGEFISGLAGEAVKVTAMARTLGGAGFSGLYKWTASGFLNNVSRRAAIDPNFSLDDALLTPDAYIEASLFGVPFVLPTLGRAIGGKLRRFIKRPVSDIPGEPFFRNGKILRQGKQAKGGPITDITGKEFIEPPSIFGTNAPAKQLYDATRKLASETSPIIKDAGAKFLDDVAVSGSFLTNLAQDVLKLHTNPAVTAKDHFKGAVRFLNQARNRGKTPEFKEFIGFVQTAMEREHIYSGMFLEDLRDAGIEGWIGSSKLLGTNIANDGSGLRAALELGRPQAQSIREVLNKAHKFASDKGVAVVGYRSNYFPRMIRIDVAEEMSGDIEGLIGKLSKKELATDLDIRLTPDDVGTIAKIAERWAGRNKKRSLAKALTHVVKDKGNGITNYGDALYYLRKQTYEDLFAPFGNLESPRLVSLPAGFFEQDARKVLPRYLRGVAKRVATVETFGKDGKIASNSLKAIEFANHSEALAAKHILDSWTGRINVSKSISSLFENTALGRHLNDLISLSTEAEVVTKIGFGFASVPNLTQVPISSAVKGGWLRAVKGGFDILSKSKRRELRRSGILLDSAADAILGYSSDNAWRGFRDLTLTMSGFSPANKLNQYWSAAIGKHYIEDLYRIANRTKQGSGFDIREFPGMVLDAMIPKLRDGRTQWAREKLAAGGVDFRLPMTDDIKSRYMWRFANETQLQKNVLREPLMANNPRLKWALLFKKFGIKQAQLIKEEAWDELLVRNNPLPMLRLAVGGYAGGESVVFAKNKLSSILSGENYYREDEQGSWDRLIENLSSVGGFGVMGDLMSTLTEPAFKEGEVKKKDFQRAVRGLKFLGAPVQAQSAFDLSSWVYNSLTKAMADPGDATQWQETMADFTKLLGTVARRLRPRLETPGQTQNRRVAQRSRKLNDLREMAIAARGSSQEKATSLWSEIMRNLDLWNTGNPELFIDVDRDLSEKVIDKRIESAIDKDISRTQPRELDF